MLRSGARGSGRMIWNASTRFQRRLRWIVLLPLPIALGALGWWIAGPVLAALLACWPVWVAATRWKASEQGVRIDDDGLRLIHRGVAIHRVAWTDVTGIDVQRRIPEGDWEYLMRGPGRRLPLVPVLSLGADRECVVWPLAVARFENTDRTEQAEETGLALLAEWARARERAAHGAVRSG